MIEKITDVKLNVRPVFIGLVHQYYYEGPCRFGKGEELEKDYDVFMNSELYRQFQKDVAENMPLDAVNMMEPIYVERDDWFLTDEDMFRTMAKDIDQVDYYLFPSVSAAAIFILSLLRDITNRRALCRLSAVRQP